LVQFNNRHSICQNIKKEHFQGMFWEHRTKAFFAVSCLTFSRINIIIIVGGEVKKKQFFSSVFVLFMII